MESGTDKIADACRKLILVSHKGDEHAKRHSVLDDEPGAEHQQNDAVGAKQKLIAARKEEIKPLQSQAGVHGLNKMIDPDAAPPFTKAKQLHAGDAAYRFDEMGLLLRLIDDGFLARRAIVAVNGCPKTNVDRNRAQRHETEPAAVEKQHDQHADAQQTIENRLHEIGRERLLNRGQSIESRDDVADVTRLEIGKRQIHKMVEKPGAPLQGDLRTHQHDRPSTGYADGELNDKQKRKPNTDDEKQILIRIDDHLIDDDL